MRIALIDDAAGELALLTGAIAALRPAWQQLRIGAFEQARSESALDADAVVVDPGTRPDAALALVQALAQRAPAAIRVVLARAHDETFAERALRVAHRVLARPLAAEILIDAIERAATLAESIASEPVRAALVRVDRLPPAPRLYLELRRLLDDPRSDAMQVGKVVAQDPALTAKLLQLCNSALYCAGRPVSDVRNAVTRLGWRTLSHLVLAAEAFPIGDGDGAVLEAAQQRALMASLLAQRILLQPGEAEAAGVAALLADIGLLLPGLGTDHERVEPERVPLHAAAGAFLLARWGLPPAVIEAVALHHTPRLGGASFGIVGGVHVALSLVCGHAPDIGFLEQVGVAGKLERWQRLHQQMNESETGASL
jgi:HD-like signal output (HDOD) protein